MFLVSVPVLIIACMWSGSIGGGDIKFLTAGGLLLGMKGIWYAFVTGVMSAGIYVLILISARKAERQSEIALGTFLSIGMMIIFLTNSY